MKSGINILSALPELEEKTFPFEIKALTEEGTFEGYAAVFDKPDAMNEVIDAGAFTKSLKEGDTRPILWYHDVRDPIGMAELTVDSKGLKVKGQLNLEVQSAREKHALMKQGAVKGLSFGFQTVKDFWNDKMRILKEVKLFEISPCTFQAHPKALITAIKSKPPKVVEPPSGTPDEGKGIFTSVIEELEGKGKPHPHLFTSVIETLEKSEKE